MHSSGNIFVPLIMLGLVVLMVVSVWKVSVKAGKPGWAAIIPFYNFYVLCQIIGWPGWMLILFLVPLVNLVVALAAQLKLAQCFGKGAGFTIGFILLPVVFLPLLAFGDAAYTAPPPKTI